MTSIYVRNAEVITETSRFRGGVLVEDGVIVEVGRGLEVGDAEEIDATGMIVMPGFVDTHRHTWQTPVRGVLPCCTLDHYFAVMLGSVGGHYRPEDVHIGDYAGALEALNAGITTMLDWSHINNTPDHADAAIQGLKKTAELVPLCHPVRVVGCDVTLAVDRARSRVTIRAEVHAHDRTGLEMEALTAVAVAALTVYDMCKAADRGMRIVDVQLEEKRGGKSGDWRR